MPNWTDVVSGNLAAVRFDATRKTLDVRFKNGSEYRYDRVTDKLVQGLIGAPSKCSFLNKMIKPGRGCTKLTAAVKLTTIGGPHAKEETKEKEPEKTVDTDVADDEYDYDDYTNEDGPAEDADADEETREVPETKTVPD